MTRYKFELSYNGKPYFGWQRQPNQISVQEEIETALYKLNHNTSISVFGCGRTDTGVHANHYVLHVDFEDGFYNAELKFKLNRILPESISIQKIETVSADFHARFDAKSRTYRYFIHQTKDPFNVDFSLFHTAQLDLKAMN